MPFDNGPIDHGVGLKIPIEKAWPIVKEWR